MTILRCRSERARWVTVAARLAAVAVVLLLAMGRAAAEPLVFAVATNVHASPAWVAQANGYFADEGLALTLTRCPASQVCLRQLLDGKAQWATAADAPIAVAAFDRQDFAVVSTMTTSGTELGLVALRDRHPGSVADLRGRRIAVTLGSGSHYYLELALRVAGLGLDDVKVVALPPDQPAQALLRGDVDAAVLYEPNLADTVKRLAGRGIELPPVDFFRLQTNIVSLPRARLDDATTGRLLRALHRANRFIADEPKRSQAIVAKALGMQPDAVASAWPAFRFELSLDLSLVRNLEGHARWARRAELVPAQAPMPDLLKLVHAEPLRQVLPSAATVLR